MIPRSDGIISCFKIGVFFFIITSTDKGAINLRVNQACFFQEIKTSSKSHLNSISKLNLSVKTAFAFFIFRNIGHPWTNQIDEELWQTMQTITVMFICSFLFKPKRTTKAATSKSSKYSFDWTIDKAVFKNSLIEFRRKTKKYRKIAQYHNFESRKKIVKNSNSSITSNNNGQNNFESLFFFLKKPTVENEADKKIIHINETSIEKSNDSVIIIDKKKRWIHRNAVAF